MWFLFVGVRRIVSNGVCELGMCVLGSEFVGVAVDWYCGSVVVCGRSFFGMRQRALAV